MIRDKLLDIAEQLFAEKGFSGTTIREITSKAGCNVSAVNYYFGSKKELYLAVFKERFLMRAQVIKDTFEKFLEKEEKSFEGIIRAFVKAFFLCAIPIEERIRSHRLIARELTEPSEAFDLILEQVFRPFFQEVVNLLKNYVPLNNSFNLCLGIMSIHAQVLYFNFNRRVIEKLCGINTEEEEFLKELISHIVEFSLRGLGKK